MEDIWKRGYLLHSSLERLNSFAILAAVKDMNDLDSMEVGHEYMHLPTSLWVRSIS